MSHEIAKALQQLAGEFYRRELQLAEYRARRRDLLSMLFDIEESSTTRPRVTGRDLSPDQKVATHAQSADRQIPVENRIAATVKPHGARGAVPAASAGKRRMLPIYVAVVLGVGAALGILFWTAGEDATPPAAEALMVRESADAAAHGVVKDFLEENIWDDQRLDKLAERWLSLAPEQRAAAQGTPWLTRFQHEVEDLIDEQRAVGSLTGNESSLALARAIGLDVPIESTAEKAPEVVSEADVEPARSSRETTRPAAGMSQIPAEATVTPVDTSIASLPGNQTEGGSTGTGDATGGVTKPAAVAGAKPVETQTETDSTGAGDVTDGAGTTPVGISDAKPLEKQTEADSTGAADAISGAETPAPIRPLQAHVCHAGLLRTRSATCRDTLTDGSFGPRLVVIPAGQFQMGDTWAAEEQPVRRVSVIAPFAIGQFELSHADFLIFCSKTGRDCPVSPWGGAEFPVVNVSWNDADAYLAWLSEQTGRMYRLPTEAEWEYAARAGSDTRYPLGDELGAADARFDTDSPMPNDDRRINSNRFRLYHVVGNVREWVQDHWIDNYTGAPGDAGTARVAPGSTDRVVRGGCYTDKDVAIRTTSRLSLAMAARDTCTGFRILRELDS